MLESALQHHEASDVVVKRLTQQHRNAPLRSMKSAVYSCKGAASKRRPSININCFACVSIVVANNIKSVVDVSHVDANHAVIKKSRFLTIFWGLSGHRQNRVFWPKNGLFGPFFAILTG